MAESWNWATEYGVKQKHLQRGPSPFKIQDFHRALGDKKTWREKAFGATGGIVGGALGSFHGRLFTGAALGGLIGRAGSESNTETGRALDTMGGLTTGLEVAALTFPGALGVLRGAASRTFLGGPRQTPGGPRSHRSIIGMAARGSLSTAKGILGFVSRNPRTSLLLGGAGLGLNALAGTRGTTSNLSQEETMNYISSIGGTSRVNNELFMGSTEGLTLGLHRGRHQ